MATRRRSTYAAALLKASEERASALVETGATVGRLRELQGVACSRHEERDFGASACALSSALKAPIWASRKRGSDGPMIVRMASRQNPSLRLYARVRKEDFVESLRGVSLLRPLAELADFTDKEVQIEVVEAESIQLDHAELIIRERFLSKRDLWHFQMVLSQDGGQVLYSGLTPPFVEHVYKARLTQLAVNQERHRRPVFSGVASPKTQIRYRSSSAVMFLLIQVSAELWSSSLSGRPYADMLVECFGTLLEKSLKSSSSDGHYVFMILFMRYAKEEKESSNESEGEFEDLYEVFWEGYARMMPPIAKLLQRLRHVFFVELCNDTRSWQGANKRNIFEASHGNVLEAFHLALDHFDSSHLDTKIEVTGQFLTLLTAGNGILRPSSRYLYELTDRRFLARQSRCEMLCVREPPLQAVPCILLKDDDSSFSGCWPRKRHQGKPPWLIVTFYPEITFCGCAQPNRLQRTCASFLPLEALSHQQTKYVPEWRQAEQDLESDSDCNDPFPLLPPSSWSHADLPPPMESLTRCSSASEAIYPSGVSQCNTPGKLMSPILSAISPSVTASAIPFQHFTAPVNHCQKPKNSERELLRKLNQEEVLSAPDEAEFTGPEFWDRIRAIPLSHLYYDDVRGDNPLKGAQNYIVNPLNRFGARGEDEDDNALAIMHDLAGVRLVALPASQICLSNSSVEPRHKHFQTGFKHGAPSSPDAVPSFILQTRFMPSLLDIVRVKSGDDLQWELQVSSSNISVSYENARPDGLDKMMYWYCGFVRRRLVRTTEENENGFVGKQICNHCECERPAQARPEPRRLDSKGHGRRPGNRNNDEWLKCERVFHQPMALPWNRIDLIVAGNEEMPAAFPFPISECDETADAPGWEFGPALKQQTFVLTSLDSNERSHFGCFNEVLQQVSESASGAEFDPGIPVGHEPFPEVVHNHFKDTHDTVDYEAVRTRFKTLKAKIEEVCFGRTNQKLNISLNNKGFYVQRARARVEIRFSTLPSAFPESRDWFEVFHDDAFVPPKLFTFTVQWMVCSSMHLVNFVRQLQKLAKDSGFKFLRVPIGQLFAQPAPSYVWTHEKASHETNFDRLPFYPRRVFQLPAVEDESKPKLWARLLLKWISPPLNLLFLFSAQKNDYRINPFIPINREETMPANMTVYRRQKGWTLCDEDCLCFVILRKSVVYWYESSILHLTTRGSTSTSKTTQSIDSCLQRLDEVYQQFYEVLVEVAESFA